MGHAEPGAAVRASLQLVSDRQPIASACAMHTSEVQLTSRWAWPPTTIACSHPSPDRISTSHPGQVSGGVGSSGTAPHVHLARWCGPMLAWHPMS